MMIQFYTVLRKPNLEYTVPLKIGTSLAVQWLRLRAFTAGGGGTGSIPGQGTKIPHAVWLTPPPSPHQKYQVRL